MFYIIAKEHDGTKTVHAFKDVIETHCSLKYVNMKGEVVDLSRYTPRTHHLKSDPLGNIIHETTARPSTRGVAIGNVFMLEDWFFNQDLSVSANWGPQKLTPKVSGVVVQGGGGNPYQPTSGVVIPNASGNSKNKIISKNSNGTETVHLWSAEGDLINILYKHKGEKETINIMQQYRETAVSKKDIQDLAKKGVKHIRISMGWWVLAGKQYKIIHDPYYDGTTSDRPKVRQLQGGIEWIEQNLCKWAAESKMNIILDIHACPGGSSYGVSYAGLPAVWNGTTYEWLKGVFFISKTCQDKFLNTIIPNALAFIKRVNTTHSGLVSAFEPMNEPGLGFYGVAPPDNWEITDWVDNKPIPSLGTYKEIYSAYQKCFLQFQKEVTTPEFKDTQFWIQVYFGAGYAAEGFDYDHSKAWPILLNNLIPYLPEGKWPNWLALDYHWYQTWDIPICDVSCCTSLKPSVCTGTDCVNCSMFSVLSKCDGGGVTCKTLCKNTDSAKKVFNEWLNNIMVGDFTQVFKWFKQYFPDRLNNLSLKKGALYKLLSCTEWAIATAPPREPYQQCDNSAGLLTHFFNEQRDIYDKYGIINCYWTLKCPQSGKIENPWSYQWLENNGVINE